MNQDATRVEAIATRLEAITTSSKDATRVEAITNSYFTPNHQGILRLRATSESTSWKSEGLLHRSATSIP